MLIVFSLTCITVGYFGVTYTPRVFFSALMVYKYTPVSLESIERSMQLYQQDFLCRSRSALGNSYMQILNMTEQIRMHKLHRKNQLKPLQSCVGPCPLPERAAHSHHHLDRGCAGWWRLGAHVSTLHTGGKHPRLQPHHIQSQHPGADGASKCVPIKYSCCNVVFVWCWRCFILTAINS